VKLVRALLSSSANWHQKKNAISFVAPLTPNPAAAWMHVGVAYDILLLCSQPGCFSKQVFTLRAAFPKQKPNSVALSHTSKKRRPPHTLHAAHNRSVRLHSDRSHRAPVSGVI
jgi:hypothetical protein